ncbi:MAG: hypothetical protein CVU88_01955 [Firmicutes bacterium HGW-Firmicutes-13]|nr:MAG: hypothetical protein CVU88_01955 [Firmicutes bacterium HGW-Firmicutes-13]
MGYVDYRSKGFMLLELLLCLTLLSMVLSSVFTFYFMGLNSYREGWIKVELQQNTRIGMDKINRELKWARHYNVKPMGNEIEFYQLNDFRKYTFRLRNRELEYIIGSTVTKVADNIESLYFSMDEHGVVIYTITAEDGGNTLSLTSSVKPRNLVM